MSKGNPTFALFFILRFLDYFDFFEQTHICPAFCRAKNALRFRRAFLKTQQVAAGFYALTFARISFMRFAIARGFSRSPAASSALS